MYMKCTLFISLSICLYLFLNVCDLAKPIDPHTVLDAISIGVLPTPIKMLSNTVWDLWVLPNHIRALSLYPQPRIMFSQISLWVGVSVFAQTPPHTDIFEMMIGWWGQSKM